MGKFEPSAQRFQQLSAPENAEERRSSGTPYPFQLVHWTRTGFKTPLRPIGAWSGNGCIRGQLIHRGSGCTSEPWEELVNDSFPELVDVGALPNGTVLDGEVICWQPEGEATPWDLISCNDAGAAKPSEHAEAGMSDAFRRLRPAGESMRRHPPAAPCENVNSNSTMYWRMSTMTRHGG